MKNEAEFFIDFSADFGALWHPSGPPLGCLLATFGGFWRPLGLILAPHGPHFGPSGRHPEPFQRHGLILEVFSFTLDRFWAHFSLSFTAFELPWDSLCIPLALILAVQVSN